MQVREFIIRDGTGAALPGAKARVVLAGTNTLASLQTLDEAGALVAAPNPYQADDTGRVTIAAPDGVYDMELSLDGAEFLSRPVRIEFKDDFAITLDRFAAGLLSGDEERLATTAEPGGEGTLAAWGPNGNLAATGVPVPTGGLVGASSEQTFTNKTIDGGQNTLTNVDAATLEGKSAPDGALVGTTDAQTLMNKVLDAASNSIRNVDAAKLGGKVAPEGAIVGATDAQTLTNKVIDADRNTVSNVNATRLGGKALSDLLQKGSFGLGASAASNLGGNSVDNVPAEGAIASHFASTNTLDTPFPFATFSTFPRSADRYTQLAVEGLSNTAGRLAMRTFNGSWGEWLTIWTEGTLDPSRFLVNDGDATTSGKLTAAEHRAAKLSITNDGQYVNNNVLFARDATVNHGASFQLQRIENDPHPSGGGNPRALRIGYVQHDTGNANHNLNISPWAVSAEFDQYNPLATGGGEGGLALSGVTRRWVPNKRVAFAGHLQVADETGLASSDGSLVGLEVGVKATGEVGIDNRIGIDVIAKTSAFKQTGEADMTGAVGVRIRGSNQAPARWRVGLRCENGDGVSGQMQTAIETLNSVNSSNGIGLRDTGTKLYGARFEGSYGAAAVSMDAGEYIHLGDFGGQRVRMRLNAANGTVEFLRGTTVKHTIAI